MKYLLTYLFIILTFYSKAQNLVPNYSFENYSACPMASGQVTLAIPWGNGTTIGTTDYYNSCSSLLNTPNCSGGFQIAKTGVAYIGLYAYFPPNGREYIQVKLIDSLVKNKCYYVEFFANLHDKSSLAVNNIGVNFSNIQISTTGTGFLLSLPTHILNTGNPIISDSINWVKVSGYYTALGGEQYLTIGVFFNDTNTMFQQIDTSMSSVPYAYYLVDDVTVEEVKTQQWHYRDTSMCKDESIILKPHSTDTINTYTLNWLPTNGLSCTNCNSPIAQPQSTTTYTLTKQRCNITTTDTVRVTVKDCNPISEIPNVFTPNGDGINDTFNFSIVGATGVSFSIMNRWGNLVQTTTLHQPTTILWDGHTTSGEACSDGVYFYTLQYTNSKGEFEKKNGYITLIK